MLALKFAVAALAAITVFTLVFAAVLPSQGHFERSIHIRRSVTEVAPLVTDIRTYRTWSAWAEEEPTAVYVNEAAPGVDGTGAIVSWKGDKVGVGRLTTLERSATSVTNRVDFEAPMTMTSTDRLRVEADGDGARVTWSNDATLAFPMGRLFGLMADRMVGPAYARGLERLKEQLERSPVVAR
jgi:hypothetical protein